jgi:hypothetical protein
LFTWDCKPTELRQQNTFFDVHDGIENRRFSIYELDSVAATHYLSHIFSEYGWEENGDFLLDSLSKEEFDK